MSMVLSLSLFCVSLAEPPVFKPTPLYGQPSWWGDVDEDHKGEPSESSSHHISAGLQLLTMQQSFSIVIALLLPTYVHFGALHSNNCSLEKHW